MNLDNEEEKYLREALAMLRDNYERAAKPYLDRLIEIYNIRLPAVVVTGDLVTPRGCNPLIYAANLPKQEE